LTNNSNLSTLTLTNVTQHHCLKQNNLTNSSQLTNNSISIYVPHIKSKDSIEYSGYFEWKPDDEAKIISKLIDGMKSFFYKIEKFFCFLSETFLFEINFTR
jgi:hypothetical protein